MPARFRDIFEQQAQWILEHHDAQGIELVLHTGDIVDTDVPAQWQVAAESLHRLDGVVPYLLTTGNHDVNSTRASLVANYFRIGEMDTEVWQPMSRDGQRLDNAFGVIELGGGRGW